MAEIDDPAAAERLVGGRFRIVGLLGSGGTASVYEALDTASGEQVALKLLHPHLAEQAALREAFVREAEVLGDIRHPALCAPRGAGIDEGEHEPRAWTAWELAPGMTLAEAVRERGGVAPAVAVDVVARVLDGLQLLHDAGLVHRDVSPSNIVVDLVGDRVRGARLVDFGLVGEAGATTRGSDVLRSRAVGDDAGGVIGNVSYASPEQLRGDPVGAASDVYSSACVLYFALVGTPPFARTTQAETIRAHETAVPPVASVRARRVPSALDRAIVRGLMKDPGARHPSSSEFRAAVLHAVARDHTTAVPGQEKTRVLGAPSGTSVDTVVAPHPDPMAGAPSPVAEAGRASSPWLWVLTAGAVALVVVVAIALIPRAEPVGAQESPAPVATTPPATTEPSADPSPTTAVAAPAAIPVVAVPGLDGLSEAEARSVLEAAGLVLGGVERADAASPAGIVIAMSPAAGEQVDAGAAVSIIVATGANAVPAVAGLTAAAAEEQLRVAGFGAAVQRVASSATPGTVLRTDPDALTRLSVGIRILLLVAEAPAPVPTPSDTPPATPTPTPTR